MKGLIHLYYGDGKGKTTASVGLAIRAVGSGFKVAFVQFMKGSDTGEVTVLKSLDNVSVLRSERDFGFFRHMPKEIQDELTTIHNEIMEKGFDYVKDGGIVVFDELTHALNFGLLDEERFRELLLNRPENVEVVMTGRNPKMWLIETADYASEIRKIKHPFDEGMAAREGIEL